MTSEDPTMGKQGTAGRRKLKTWMIFQKLEIIGRRESGTSRRGVMASHNAGLSPIL